MDCKKSVFIKITRLLFCQAFFLGLLSLIPTYGQRYVENLGRGLVAVSTGGSNVFLSWRMLGTDPTGITFNVYRNGTKVNSNPLTVCNYTDNSGSTGAAWPMIKSWYCSCMFSTITRLRSPCWAP